MEKYIQIYNLSESMDDEEVCACYPDPMKNISGKKNEECILNAEKEAHEGKCKLLVLRNFNEFCQYNTNYILISRDVEQIAEQYNNAKTAMKECSEQNNPEHNIEYGKALAFESVLAMLGYDVEEVRKKYWVEKHIEPPYGREVEGTPELLEKAALTLTEIAHRVVLLENQYIDGLEVDYQGDDESDSILCPSCRCEVARNDDYAEMRPKHCPECGTKLKY